MAVLIACEESQVVTIAFRELGIEAYSCDLEPCSGNHPEWHLQQDVTPLLEQDWDLIIGHPPCFAGDTLVLTKNGYKNIKDIVVGEEVLTHNKRWRKVTSTSERLSDKTVEVRFSGSSRIITTEEHPFYIAHRSWKHIKRVHTKIETAPDWKKIKDINKGDLSVFCLPPEINADVTDNMLWLYGRYVADGHLRYRNGKYESVTFSVGKKKFEEFKKHVGDDFKIYECRTAYKFIKNSNDFSKLFEQFGRGAKNKTLPGWVLSLPKQQAQCFLDGYLSGDGYINNKSKQITASSISKKLMLGISLLMIRVYNRATNIQFRKNSKTTIIENRVVNQSDSYGCRCAMPENGKKSLATIKNGYIYNVFRKKEEKGSSIVYNLSVEEDESYIVDQCIVHNCTHLSVSGAKWFEQKRKDGRQQQGIDFFMKFANCKCPLVAIENPIGIMSSKWRKPDQIIQPWMFGHPESKATCLWLKGLPLLKATNNVEAEYKKLPKNVAQRMFHLPPSPDRAKLRSKTYLGIAKSFAEQWSPLLNKGIN